MISSQSVSLYVPNEPTVIAELSEIESAANEVAVHNQSQWNQVEMRSSVRTPYPNLVGLTPLQNESLRDMGEPFYVVGKRIGLGGIDFFHNEKIEFHYALASFERCENDLVHFILKISHCKFRRPGWYESGGRFVKLVQYDTGEE